VSAQKVLVIDDSRVIRARIREMLPESNFEILEAEDGLQGFNLMQQAHPDLILLDFLLPRMSGWDVYQRIQHDPSLQALPLVVMSGRKEEVTEKLPEPFEHFEFIGKPFEQDQLISAIRTAMAKARERAKSQPVPSGLGSAGNSAELQSLREQVQQLESEVQMLKKQLAQVVGYLRQKLG
jgi:two-component system response regulator